MTIRTACPTDKQILEAYDSEEVFGPIWQHCQACHECNYLWLQALGLGELL